MVPARRQVAVGAYWWCERLIRFFPQVMTTELVAGDIVSLETGDKIAADGLFLSGYDLRIDESSLTGESLPVRKDAKKVET